jgi:hypothetical protein
MDKDTKIKVKNRSASMVIYNIPDMGIRREYTPNEVKTVSFEELEKLSYQMGGLELINDCLLINDKNALDELEIEPEEEYFLNGKKEIEKYVSTCSVDQFKDCLDFAPEGVIEIIKDSAVSMPLTDTEKLDALKSVTGFDAAEARRHDLEDRKENVEKGPSKTTQRRAAAPKIAEMETPVAPKRATTSK